MQHRFSETGHMAILPPFSLNDLACNTSVLILLKIQVLAFATGVFHNCFGKR